MAFPITLASRFYNSLYYRTSRDTPITIKFDTEDYTMTPHLHAKFGQDWGERVNTGAQKIKNVV